LSAELHSKIGAYTIAEILSEPATWKACLRRVEETGELRSLSSKLLRDVEWVFIGCGSSFYLAQAAAASWSILTGEKARAIPASEIMLFPQSLPIPCQPGACGTDQRGHGQAAGRRVASACQPGRGGEEQHPGRSEVTGLGPAPRPKGKGAYWVA